jgi:hypothetical protein
MVKCLEVIMNNKRYYEWIMVVVLFATMLVGSGTASRAEEEETSRDQAGQEVKEAAGGAKEAGAVKDATRETSKEAWQKTRDESRQIYHRAKEESGEAWEKTRQTSESTWDTIKQESREIWKKLLEESKKAITDTKARIHEATAPEPAKPAPEKPEQE